VTSSDGYTVTVSNTTAAAVSLTSFVVNLRTGFTYTAGSTTGGIAVDPTVTSGPTLTWTGSFTVPGNGAAPPTTTTTVPVTTTTTKPVVGTSALPVKGLPIALVIVAAVGALVWLRRRRVVA
jgi:hypothetical protein